MKNLLPLLNRRSLPLGISAFAVGLLVYLWLGASRRPTDTAPERAKEPPTQAVESITAKVSPAPQVAAANVLRPESLPDRLASALSALRAKSPDTPPDEYRRIFAELRATILKMPKDQAGRDLLDFLKKGQDAGTPLDLTVQSGGAMGDASSLRVFLMGVLSEVDPPAAGALGRQILGTPSSPDEWAISLRNVARSDASPATTAYLQGKAAELLQQTAWHRNPTAGYLEAFDVIVHTRATALAPQLSALVREKENRAIAHAAYLTLDRLTISDAAPTLEQLVAQPDLMQGREKTRANLFARADVRDPKQKSVLERYLMDPSRSAEELQTFAGIYPNANFMVSHNLMSSVSTPGRQEIVEHDQAALANVEQWLADPRFEKQRPMLESIQRRLQMFVNQAAAAETPNP